jgi:malonyl CoA-acyl carrier protein transacylase
VRFHAPGSASARPSRMVYDRRCEIALCPHADDLRRLHWKWRNPSVDQLELAPALEAAEAARRLKIAGRVQAAREAAARSRHPTLSASPPGLVAGHELGVVAATAVPGAPELSSYGRLDPGGSDGLEPPFIPYP